MVTAMLLLLLPDQAGAILYDRGWSGDGTCHCQSKGKGGGEGNRTWRKEIVGVQGWRVERRLGPRFGMGGTFRQQAEQLPTLLPSPLPYT